MPVMCALATPPLTMKNKRKLNLAEGRLKRAPGWHNRKRRLKARVIIKDSSRRSIRSSWLKLRISQLPMTL